MKRLAPVLAALALALLATGCASSGGALTSRGADQRSTEIERLQKRVLDLQQRLSVTEVELERLRAEVARLSGSPIERGASSGGASSARSVSRDRTERARFAEEPVGTSDRGFEIEDIGAEERPSPPAAPPTAVEETPAEARERPAVRVSPPTPAEEPAGSARREAPEPAELTAAAQELYDRGYALYHQGRFVDAESTFQQFLQAHAGTELGDNAQYWIGEARFARGELKGALAAFRETARRFPDGNKVPDALLKAGETRAAMGDRDGAVETYREVVRSFSGTTAAAVARDRLAGLGEGG